MFYLSHNNQVRDRSAREGSYVLVFHAVMVFIKKAEVEPPLAHYKISAILYFNLYISCCVVIIITIMLGHRQR